MNEETKKKLQELKEVGEEETLNDFIDRFNTLLSVLKGEK